MFCAILGTKRSFSLFSEFASVWSKLEDRREMIWSCFNYQIIDTTHCNWFCCMGRQHKDRWITDPFCSEAVDAFCSSQKYVFLIDFCMFLPHIINYSNDYTTLGVLFGEISNRKEMMRSILSLYTYYHAILFGKTIGLHHWNYFNS